MSIIIPDIPLAVYKEKEKKIKLFPCYVNRASSLGYFVPELQGCLRRGVYERTRWQEKEMHDGRVQAIFDEGNEQERIVNRDIADAGIELIEQQRSYDWPRYQITGHIDGKIVCETENGPPIGVPCEIKSMAPHIFTSIHKFEDFLARPWHRSYMVQITLYMLMEELDIAIFILKNKSTGELKQIPVNLDYQMGEWALKAAEAINKHVADNTLPDKVDDIDVCSHCPFKGLCLPDICFGAPLTIADDPALESKIRDYLLHKDDAKHVKDLYEKQIRPKCQASADAMRGELNVMVGPYHLTGKYSKSGSFLLKIEEV